jgi:phosphatidylserine decarboxylase
MKPQKIKTPWSQYSLPQHALSRLAGFLANHKTPWLKNYLIRYFVNRYPVNMEEAMVSDPYAYSCFNTFFTRELKSAVRPITPDTHHLASPVDGGVFQSGTLQGDPLLQVKGHHFHVDTLLGQEPLRTQTFANGHFATFYLAPKDYHRVHMPYPGRLREMIYVPGKLFSVNPTVIRAIPNIFARNERLICIFDTDRGAMAVILVGAMLVAGIHTAWSGAIKTSKTTTWCYPDHLEEPIILSKGEYLGHFQLGSTVIVLFPPHTIHWETTLKENAIVRMGQSIGYVIT